MAEEGQSYCEVCSDPLTDEGKAVVKACGLATCTTCLNRAIETHVFHYGMAGQPCCPACGEHEVALCDIWDLMDSHLRSQLERYSVQAALAVIREQFWCGCGSVVTFDKPGAAAAPALSAEDQERLGGLVHECSGCGVSMCVRCRTEPHPGRTCDRNKAEQVLTSDEQLLEMWRSAGNIIDCPICGAPTMRDGGCQIVRCRCCNHKWIWRGKGRLPRHHRWLRRGLIGASVGILGLCVHRYLRNAGWASLLLDMTAINVSALMGCLVNDAFIEGEPFLTPQVLTSATCTAVVAGVGWLTGYGSSWWWAIPRLLLGVPVAGLNVYMAVMLHLE